MTEAKQHAAKLLDRLIDLDQTTQMAYYEMGQLLSSIDHGKLYEILGYGSVKEMVEEELSFGSGTAHRYKNAYRNFRRLGYTKLESLNLINEFSFTRISDWLRTAKDKVGTRAIRNAIEAKGTHQINFTLSQAEYDEVAVILQDFGAKWDGESERWSNSTEAFVAAMHAVDYDKAA